MDGWTTTDGQQTLHDYNSSQVRQKWRNTNFARNDSPITYLWPWLCTDLTLKHTLLFLCWMLCINVVLHSRNTMHMYMVDGSTWKNASRLADKLLVYSKLWGEEDGEEFSEKPSIWTNFTMKTRHSLKLRAQTGSTFNTETNILGCFGSMAMGLAKLPVYVYTCTYFEDSILLRR